MSNTALQQSVDRLAEKVLVKRPILRKILKQKGRMNVRAYAREFGKTDKTISPELKQELIDTIADEAFGLWGVADLADFKEHLNNNYFALTGDHHGPLGHPFFISSNLLAATDVSQKYVLILAASNVSLNNSSHPRGLVYHELNNQMHRLNLFPSSRRHDSVFGALGYTARDLQRAEKNISNSPVRVKLLKVIEEILSDPEVLKQNRFGHQASMLNEKLWLRFFPSGSASPKLKHLELEKVVVRLLTRHHLSAITPIHQIIFDDEKRKQFIEKFEGIMGSFNRNTGTVLFWYLPLGISGLTRERLRVEGSELVSLDSAFKLDISAKNIKNLLTEGRLIPNTIFSQIILSAYYGLKCLGGFSQTTYLSQAQGLYTEMFDQKSDSELHTQTLGTDLTIAYLQIGDQLIPATGLDLILHGHPESWQNFLDTANALTLAESFYPTLPGLYKELYPEAEREPELSSITTADIIEALVIKPKINAIGAI